MSNDLIYKMSMGATWLILVLLAVITTGTESSVFTVGAILLGAIYGSQNQ